MFFKYLLNYVIIFSICHISRAARILAIFPVPSISHQLVFRELTQELARRGHELTIITPDPVFTNGDAPNNIREIDIREVSYKVWRDYFVLKLDSDMNDIPEQVQNYYEAMMLAMDIQWNRTEIQELIHGEHNFDLILSEAILRFPMAFYNKYKVPIIQVSSLGALDEHYETFGVPNHPFIFKGMLQKRSENLTLWEKILLLYDKYRIKTIMSNSMELENNLIKKYYGEHALLSSELLDKVDLLFLNVNSIWEENRPIPPCVIYTGGMHMKPPKDLPKVNKIFFYCSLPFYSAST